MLDPLTALSVAGNIVQFVDFSIKLVARGTELYNSADGASIGNAELEVIANDLQELNSRLQPSPPAPDTVKTNWTADTALHKLTEQCSTVAGELLQALNRLKVEGTSNRRWKSVRQALKALMKKDEVDAIVQRLQHFRDELNLHILVSMRDTLDMQAVKQTEGFRNLDKVAKDLVDKLDTDQLQLRDDLRAHTSRLGHNQYQTNELISREHRQTRRIILASIQSGQSGDSYSENRASSEDSDSCSEPTEREKRKKRRQKQKEKEESLRIESLLLQSLRFSTMENRFEEIEPAHRTTYEWIFRSPAAQSRWSDFPHWLEEGTGIYWINGKAASGKSTLMRFICDNPRTTVLLEHWSKPKQLIIATHFFWYSGTKDQRSYTGLLRALLFKILQQSRYLIRVIFPDKWAKHYGNPAKVDQDPESWTLPRLIEAFEHLFQQASHELRFCLFVDGLDEYDGDSFDIIDLFTRISTLSNVKLCLSSRPLYEFVRMFRSFPKLRLQDLNFGDIKRYVDDELGDNYLMQELQRKEPEEAPKLVLEIIDKADGVFLWVKLVVLSLLRGLRNSDQIFDLQRRLRLLPPSLEDLFSHILGRLEPVYLEQSSRIFQIFVASLLSDKPLTSLELSLAEEPDATSLLLSRTEHLSEAQIVSRIELVDIWLVTRCGGLIEAIISSDPLAVSPNLSYLHRTVRDFLELPQIWSRILGLTRGSDFNAHVSLLQSNVLFINLVIDSKRTESLRLHSLDYVLRALRHAYLAQWETNQADVFLLDELANVVEYTFPQGGDDHDDFPALATRNGLYHYVAHKIECDPNVVRKKAGRPLLEYAVVQNLDVVGNLQLSSKMVGMLLQHGSHPNQVYKGDCAWHSILRRLRNTNRKRDGDRLVIQRNHESLEMLKIIQLFIENGANIYQDTYERVFRNFMADFPEETMQLHALMVVKKALKKED
ncbi:hypothetical protein L207DRAFT_535085 [Hyaloscypha variabilis F]|uniref:Uncharacterized protein n=1 Tax=Hyaloscypha variabilis (strain UAMH 11265 / GT02V1 / F) TaxID=1149755 RepID=A0A2J6R5Q6_HYAVF|nr:hypothetical protein L207DRAFT_535085 [Hyaloscypha variabilis F]